MKQLTTYKWVLLVVAFFATTFTYAQKYTGLTATTSGGLTPAQIFDGNTTGSGWQDGAQNVDNAWITVDLGSVKSVDIVKIYWEAANAKDYKLLVSDDNSSYTEVKDFVGLAAGDRTDVITGLNTSCRYIMMQGVTRQLPYAYQIFEFEVYPATGPELTTLTITPAKSTILLGASQQLTVAGFDLIGDPFTLTETTNWSVDGVGATISATGLFESTAKGIFTVTATNGAISTTTTVEVFPTNANLSIGATATSSTGNGQQAIDGNLLTRWESASTDPQEITIDLGELKVITDFIIYWETASSKESIIEGSENGIDWTPITEQNNMAAGENRIDRLYNFSSVARFVRLTSILRTTPWGNSIWEFKIYGEEYTPTGIRPLSPANKVIAVYPTAASSSISVNSIEAVASINIYNLLGQSVKSASSIENGSSINISDLPKGNYIVKIVTVKNEIYTQQITKK